MKILALDFSSPQRSVALGDEAVGLEIEVVDPSTGREMKPFALIEAALQQAKWEREAIECIAVGLGPGSYTGIRVAISLAQGWQLATGVKLLGISSEAGIAAQAVALGVTGKFSVVIDAQRGEFYRAGYEMQADVAREIEPLRLVSRAEVQEREQAGELVVGPEVLRWFPAGRVVFPTATILARLASRRDDFLPGERLEPIYLREPTFVKAPPARPLPFTP